MQDQIIEIKGRLISLEIRCQRSNGTTYTSICNDRIYLENKHKSNFGMMHFTMTNNFYDAVGNYLAQQ